MLLSLETGGIEETIVLATLSVCILLYSLPIHMGWVPDCQCHGWLLLNPTEGIGKQHRIKVQPVGAISSVSLPRTWIYKQPRSLSKISLLYSAPSHKPKTP